MTKLTSDNLLPAPSILQKLEDLFPGAADMILAYAETIGQESRERRSKNPPPRGENRPTLTLAWAQTGDYLRLGISRYMKEQGLSSESLGLDTKETASLALLLPETAQPPARSKFFRKIFPKL